jgi:hypothetical protein
MLLNQKTRTMKRDNLSENFTTKNLVVNQMGYINEAQVISPLGEITLTLRGPDIEEYLAKNSWRENIEYLKKRLDEADKIALLSRHETFVDSQETTKAGVTLFTRSFSGGLKVCYGYTFRVTVQKESASLGEVVFVGAKHLPHPMRSDNWRETRTPSELLDAALSKYQK